MIEYARELLTLNDSTAFLKNIVQLKNSDSELITLAKTLLLEESLFKQVYNKQTLFFEDFRENGYKDLKKRRELGKKITHELLSLPMLENENQIKLGIGGGLPISLQPSSDKLAFYIIGLPASGKSTIAYKLSKIFNAFILDIDLIKYKLPELQNTYGACVTHQEASQIMWEGIDDISILQHCLANKWNIIIPKIGNKLGIIHKNTEILLKEDYKVHLILANVDRKVSVKRAFGRFLQTNRYISLPLIFDTYSNEPNLNYYKLRASCSQFISFQAYDCNDTPKLIDVFGNSLLSKIPIDVGGE